MFRDLVALALALTVAACGAPSIGEATSNAIPVPAPVAYVRDTPLPGAAHAVFILARPGAPKGGFFDLPWPSELRRRDGRPNFDGYPGEGDLIVGEYVETAKRAVDDFSVAPVIYVRFEGKMTGVRFPTPAETLTPRSPIALVDVDPASPERGRRVPLEARMFGPGAKYVPPATLALKPVAGFALRPATLYAAVVRRALGDASGQPLGTARDLEIVKNTKARADSVEETARALHAPALDALAALGIARDDVATVAVFRTQRPAAKTEVMLAETARLTGADAPHLLSASWLESPPHRGRATPTTYATMKGYYCTPNFQGELERAPFLDGGGEVVLDAKGAPRVVPVPAASPYHANQCGNLLHARFVLSVPNRPMPARGFPLLLTAHGTSGNAFGFLGEDDFAGWAAAEGIAVVSTDQPIHGADDPASARPGSREPIVLRLGGFPLPLGSGKAVNELGFYNPLHPGAARDNLRQAAVDGFALLHLIAATDFARVTDAAGAPMLTSGGRPPPRFDATRLAYGGHSQGSQSAMVLGALDPTARAVVLSGCGGDLRIGIMRRRDLSIGGLVGTLLGVAPDELDEFHPLLSLVQTLADPVDPVSYGRFYWPRGSGERPPPPVLHLEGLNDSFNPMEAADALAVALRATSIGRVIRPVLGLTLLDDAHEARTPTASFLALRPTFGEDGHFVLYYEPEAARTLRSFLRTSLAAETR